MPIIARYHQEFEPDPLKLLDSLTQAHKEMTTTLTQERQALRSEIADLLLKSYRKSKMQAHRLAFKQSTLKLNESLLELKKLRSEILETAYQDCLNLSLEICREYTGKILIESKPEFSQHLQNVLEKYATEDLLEVKANSQTIALLARYCQHQLTVDNTLENGNLQVITSRGECTIRWQTQFQLLQERLNQLLNLRLKKGV